MNNTNTQERTAPGIGQLYSIHEAAKIIGMKPGTLRAYIRRQSRVKPFRASAGARGTLLLTSADLMAIWEYIQLERGY